MANLKNSVTASIQFFKRLNKKTIKNNTNSDQFEFTYTKFGLNLKQTSDKGKVPNSLFYQMYAEENETLFI